MFFDVDVRETYTLEIDVKDFLSYYSHELNEYKKQEGEEHLEDIDFENDNMELGLFLEYLLFEKNIDTLVGLKYSSKVNREVEVY